MPEQFRRRAALERGPSGDRSKQFRVERAEGSATRRVRASGVAPREDAESGVTVGRSISRFSASVRASGMRHLRVREEDFLLINATIAPPVAQASPRAHATNIGE